MAGTSGSDFQTIFKGLACVSETFLLERKNRKRWAEYGLGLNYMTDEKREILTMEKLSQILPEV